MPNLNDLSAKEQRLQVIAAITLEPGAEYGYIGDGLGVAGLPHSLTTEDAARLGVTDLLRAALAAGTYELK